MVDAEPGTVEQPGGGETEQEPGQALGGEQAQHSEWDRRIVGQALDEAELARHVTEHELEVERTGKGSDGADCEDERGAAQPEQGLVIHQSNTLNSTNPRMMTATVIAATRLRCRSSTPRICTP